MMYYRKPNPPFSINPGVTANVAALKYYSAEWNLTVLTGRILKA